MDTSTGLFVGIDIGSSTIKGVAGLLTGDGGVQVSGYTVKPALGMRKGMINDIAEVSISIRQVVSELERQTGQSILAATININGDHIEAIESTGTIATSTGTISDSDIERAIESSKAVNLQNNREIIAVYPKTYRVDGHTFPKNPSGMKGVRLEVDVLLITVVSPILKNLTLAMEEARLGVNSIEVSTISSGEIALGKSQKENGVAMVDIGLNTVNLTVYEDNEIYHTVVIPVGSSSITNELAIELKCDLDIAEEIKVEHATLEEVIKRATINIKKDNKHYTYNSEHVRSYVGDELVKILDQIDKELIKINKSHKLPGGIVFSGSTCNIAGFGDFATKVMGLSCRVAKITDMSGLIEACNDPTYTTALGLMIRDIYLALSQDTVTKKENTKSISSKLKKIFKLK